MSLESLIAGTMFLSLERGLKATRTPFLLKILEIFWEMPSTKGREAFRTCGEGEGFGIEVDKKKDSACLKALEIFL